MKQNGNCSSVGFFSHLCKRLKSETPIFFKKVFYFMSSLSALGASFVGFNDSLPIWMQGIGGYLLAVGAVGAFLAKTTTTDVELSGIKQVKEG